MSVFSYWVVHSSTSKQCFVWSREVLHKLLSITDKAALPKHLMCLNVMIFVMYLIFTVSAFWSAASFLEYVLAWFPKETDSIAYLSVLSPCLYPSHLFWAYVVRADWQKGTIFEDIQSYKLHYSWYPCSYLFRRDFSTCTGCFFSFVWLGGGHLART